MARRLLLVLLLCLSHLCGTASLNDSNSSEPVVHSEHAQLHVATEDAPAPVKRSPHDLLHRAVQKAIGGGVPGAIAGVVQVLGLMWLVRNHYMFHVFHRPINKMTTFIDMNTNIENCDKLSISIRVNLSPSSKPSLQDRRSTPFILWFTIRVNPGTVSTVCLHSGK